MPGATLSIREAIANAVKEPDESDPETPQHPSPEPESKESVSESPASPAEGFTVFEKQLLRGVNTDGWTPAQKKEWVSVRKAYEKGWHGSQAEHAAAKRFVDALKAEGITNEDVLEVVHRKKNGQPPAEMSATETKRVLRGIDRLIEESTDPAVKEQLRQSKSVIQEEMEHFAEGLSKQFTERLDRLESSTRTVRESEVSSEVDALEDELGYPAALVERYRADLIRVKLQQPKWSMKKILRLVATEEEIEEAEAPASRGTGSNKPARQPPVKPSSVSAATPTTSEEELKPFKRPRGGGWDMFGLIKHEVRKAERQSA